MPIQNFLQWKSGYLAIKSRSDLGKIGRMRCLQLGGRATTTSNIKETNITTKLLWKPPSIHFLVCYVGCSIFLERLAEKSNYFPAHNYLTLKILLSLRMAQLLGYLNCPMI